VCVQQVFSKFSGGNCRENVKSVRRVLLLSSGRTWLRIFLSVYFSLDIQCFDRYGAKKKTMASVNQPVRSSPRNSSRFAPYVTDSHRPSSWAAPIASTDDPSIVHFSLPVERKSPGEATDPSRRGPRGRISAVKSILVTKSTVFERMFTGSYSESTPGQEIPVDDVDLESFRVLMDFLHKPEEVIPPPSIHFGFVWHFWECEFSLLPDLKS